MNDAIRSLRTHSKSFYWAGLLLPRQTLADVALLYQFCRKMDDAIDERQAPQDVADALDRHVKGIGELSGLLKRYDIPLPVMQAFLQGLLNDAPPVRHAGIDSVLRFAYDVAGTVGLMMCFILGRRRQETLYRAIDLGIAMQLVNIARDFAEDSTAGRSYIPHGYTQSSLVELAEIYFESGIAGIYDLPVAMRPAIMTAAYLYRAIGQNIVKRPAYAERHRVVISKRFKTALTVRAVARCFVKPEKSLHRQILHAAFKDMPLADNGL